VIFLKQINIFFLKNILYETKDNTISCKKISIYEDKKKSYDTLYAISTLLYIERKMYQSFGHR
jgi:hypothetical protein